MVNLQVSENSNPEKYYRVSFSPNGSRLVMTHQEVADGIIGPDLGSTLDVSGSVATWEAGVGSHVVVGVLPSATAQRTVLLRTDHDFGGSGWDVEPVPGTDFSAFAAYFERPFLDEDPIAGLIWFDGEGQPVDQDGRIGQVTELNGMSVWVAPDGTTFGGDVGSDRSTTVSLPVDSGELSHFTGGTDGDWRTIGLLPDTARSGTAHFADGPDMDFTTAALGGNSVFVVRSAAAASLVEVQWTDADGVAHRSPTRSSER